MTFVVSAVSFDPTLSQCQLSIQMLSVATIAIVEQHMLFRSLHQAVPTAAHPQSVGRRSGRHDSDIVRRESSHDSLVAQLHPLENTQMAKHCLAAGVSAI